MNRVSFIEKGLLSAVVDLLGFPGGFYPFVIYW